MASETLDNVEEFSPAEIITNALKAWEEFNFRDLDLWEMFKEDFEGWTEEDFKLANNRQIREVQNSLRRRGVWVEKSRLTIAKSLFNTLQEEERTPWTEEEVLRCMPDEEFISHHIKSLLETDFGRNPRVHSIYKSTHSSSRPATGVVKSPTIQPPKAYPRLPSRSSPQRPLLSPPQPPLQRLPLSQRAIQPLPQSPIQQQSQIPVRPPLQSELQPESPVAPPTSVAPRNPVALLTPVAPVDSPPLTPVALVAPALVAPALVAPVAPPILVARPILVTPHAPMVPITSVTPPTPVAPVDSVALLTPVAPLTSVAPLARVALLAPVALLGSLACSLASQQHLGQPLRQALRPPLKQHFITITSTPTDYDLWHAFKGGTIASLHSGQGQGFSWSLVLQPLPPDLPLSERFQ